MCKNFGLAGFVAILALVLAGCTTHTPPIEEGIYGPKEISEIYSYKKEEKKFDCSSVSRYSMTDAQRKYCAQNPENKWIVNPKEKIEKGYTVLSRFNYLEEGRVPTACRLKNHGAAGRCLQRVAKALLDLDCPSTNDERVKRSPDCDKEPVVRANQYAKLGKVLILLDEKNIKETQKLLEE